MDIVGLPAATVMNIIELNAERVKETEYWRERFLECLPIKPASLDQWAYVRVGFLSLSSKAFLQKSPGEWIETFINEDYENP